MISFLGSLIRFYFVYQGGLDLVSAFPVILGVGAGQGEVRPPLAANPVASRGEGPSNRFPPIDRCPYQPDEMR
jgi:hypothetical protein